MNAGALVFGIVLTLVVAAASVHLVLTWMGRRGWIWYRTPDRPRPTSLGLIEEIYQPSIEHVVDQRTTEDTEADQNESGEDTDSANGP